MAEFTDPHNIAYPVSSDLIKDPNAVAKLAADIKATAVTANDAITAEGARAEEEAYQRAKYRRENIPGGVDMREWLKAKGVAGQYASVTASNTASQTGLPTDLVKDPQAYVAELAVLVTGVVITLKTFSVWGIDEYSCSSAPSTSGWTAWSKKKWDVADDDAVQGAKYGYKTAPLALTSPSDGSATETITGLSLRMPLEVGTGFGRFRVHIRNFNDRSGVAYPGAVNVTGLWFGAGNRSTGSFNAAPTQLSTGFSTPADGSEYVTPWFNAEVKAGTTYLLSLGISASSVTAVRSIASAWRFDGSSTYGATQNISWPLTTTAPLDYWIEAEVPEDTPIVAEVGSSSSVGSKATYPILESPLSLYCMSVGALPMHYAHSGSTLAIWEDQDAPKWQKYQECARPSALFLSLGSNDLFGSRTLAEIQESAKVVVGIAKSLATDNIYATTIEPRTTGDETKRRQYNTWLKTKPLGIRDVFDRSAAISNDDDTIRPEFNADGIHTNTAGNVAKANAVTRPVFRSLLQIKETAGRTVSVWDYLNQREQLIYGDTGWRDVSSLLQSGKNYSVSYLEMKRVNGEVHLRIGALTGDTGTFLVPVSGFRIDHSVGRNAGLILGSKGAVLRVNGSIYGFNITGNASDEIYTGYISWPTSDPWPSSLPGVAA